MEEDKAKCRDEKDPPLVFGVYDAFQADQNDDGGFGRQTNRLSCTDPHCPVDNRRVAVPEVACVR